MSIDSHDFLGMLHTDAKQIMYVATVFKEDQQGLLVAYSDGQRPFFTFRDEEARKTVWDTILDEHPLPCITDNALYNPSYISLLQLLPIEEDFVVNIKFNNDKEFNFTRESAAHNIGEHFLQLYNSLVEYQKFCSSIPEILLSTSYH